MERQPMLEPRYAAPSLQDLLQLQATAFICRHSGAHLQRDQLIERTAQHLQDRFDVSLTTARRVAIRAIAEHESREVRAYVDVDECTAFQVVVRDLQANVARVFTVAELMRLVAGGRG